MKGAVLTKQLIAGNWKMFMRRQTASDLASGVAEAAKSQDAADVAVCPPFLYLQTVLDAVAGSPVGVGAQDTYWEEEGAFTGEVSPEMIKDVGCTYAIVGHSERRAYFHETDETVNRKIKAVLASALTPIFCLGETLEQREAGDTEKVVSSQLRNGLAGLGSDQLRDFVVAYEPVWAIGTGVTATPDQAEEVHALLRGILEDEFQVTGGHGLRILYGGSVKPENASDILGKPHVDGALVGGASLKADAFADIISASRRSGETS
jgi:triosephosphate isomerase